MERRPFLAAVAAGVVGASAGCLSDFIENVTTFEASPIRVTEDAADEAGYTYEGTDELIEEREFSGETVEVTNYITKYARTIDLPLDAFGSDPEAGMFALVSTPQVSVAGKDFNPVGEMDEAELAEYVGGQYDGFEIGDNVGGRAVEPDDLDVSVSFETYEGTATLHGEAEMDVFVDVALPDHGGDHLAVIAVYPDDSNIPLSSERDRVDTMTAGIEHGEDVDVEINDENAQ